MHITINHDEKIKVTVVRGLDTNKITPKQADDLKSLIYKNKILVLKQQHLSPRCYLDFAYRLGMPEEYYQAMYHHPECREIFVSSNVPRDGGQVGVPRTGRFWHSDYSFMPKPFAITLIYPQIIPTQNRGTYFIDMGRAYEMLAESLKDRIHGATSSHSVLRYFKIRPHDIYRPISEIIAEVHQVTPEVQHPLTFKHPMTGETVLYISDGFTQSIRDSNGNDLGQTLVDELLTACGQRDRSFQHPLIHLQTYEPGDILLWDNRSLVHCALHTLKPEPTESFRITLHDHKPFYEIDPQEELAYRNGLPRSIAPAHMPVY